MKQKLFLLVLTVFCLAGRGAWAQVFTQGAFTFMVTDANAKTVAVWKASKNITGDLFIPSQVSNDGVTYTVTSVFKDGFKDTDISSVTIPASVDSLGPGCFGSCQKLASINIEASNKTLNMYSGEDGSFYRSFAEKSIFIGRNLKINKEWSPFFSPTSVEFGDEVTYIDDGLFRNDNVYQTKLARVVIGKNVTTIGKNAFSGTGTDASVNEMIVTIGENVTTIGSNAFSGCSKLKSINLPSSLKTICGDAFSYTGLTDITIPSSVDSLGKSCFSRCDNLARINIEASDETLKIANGENGSFYRSFAYKTIFIGRNLVLSQKNNFTFYGVTSVEFGDKVTYINEGLFKNESSYLAKLANGRNRQTLWGDGVRMLTQNCC